MNKKFKFLTVLLALVMTIGAFAPFSAVKAAEEEHKTDVVIHKVKLNDLTGWPKGEGKDDYDGSKFGEQAFKKYFGSEAIELDKVKFYVFKITEDDYKKMTKNSDEYSTKDDVTSKITGAELIKNKEKNIDYFETTTDGATVPGLENGHYWIVEDEDSVSRNGETFAGAAAVPFGLALPYAKADGKPFGTGTDALHVYPKNLLAKEPQIDKDFKGKANPEKPREDKKTAESHNVGDKIPYEVKTIFQPNTQYKTAFWTDQMTEGLTFDQDSLTVKIGNDTLTKGEDYTIDTTVNNFKVSLTEKGLEKVNNKKEKTTVVIEYTATLTNAAVVDVPESNDVVFHYGNNPDHGNTPVPNKPNENGELTITKDWDTGVSKEAVEFTLYNAQTGKKVEAKDVEEVPGYTFENPVTIEAGETMTYTWKGLDKDIEYKVVETFINGNSVEYGKTELAGGLTAKNYKDNNPEPLNPDEPKVVTRGKKFVKMEKNKDIRLKDAVFYVKNSDGQYLQPSNGADKSAFETAQKAYSDAVAAYNKLEADKQTKEEKDKVQKLADARDKAWNEYLSNMTVWGDKKTALELKSDEAGAFEIKGLKDGTYYLEEKTAPAGYGKIEKDIEFKLGEGSYTTGDINYNPLIERNDAKRVDNTKLTIPQTGGIGTVIFTVVGVMLMVGAAFALKRRKEDELEGLA